MFYSKKKDLSRLGRDLNKVIILDNSPASYIFHPDNAVSCTSWFDDPHDTELVDLIPHFERLAAVESVYHILKQPNYNSSLAYSNTVNINQQNPNSNINSQNLVNPNIILTNINTNNLSNQSTATSNYTPNQHQSITNSTPNATTTLYIHHNQQYNKENEPNQHAPVSQQTMIYQQTNENQASSSNNNYNYMLNENKILLSIDLMMASKQQQLQQQQQQQSSKQPYPQQYNLQN